jgi:hypothetical protein
MNTAPQWQPAHSTDNPAGQAVPTAPGPGEAPLGSGDPLERGDQQEPPGPAPDDEDDEYEPLL